MKPIDRTPLLKRYKGKWVALRSDRTTVIASGNSVASVLKKAQKKGQPDAVITRIPRSPKNFIGYHIV